MVQSNNYAEKTCLVCGEFISTEAVKCKHCDTIQEDYEFLGATKLIEFLRTSVLTIFTIAVCSTVYAYLTEDYDLYERTSDVLIRFFYLLIVAYLGVTILSMNEKWYSKVFDKYPRKYEITSYLKGRRKKSKMKERGMILFFGVTYVCIAVYSFQSKPTHEDFVDYLKSDTSYLEDEITETHHNDFFLSYILSESADEKVCYIGIWNNFFEFKKPM